MFPRGAWEIEQKALLSLSELANRKKGNNAFLMRYFSGRAAKASEAPRDASSEGKTRGTAGSKKLRKKRRSVVYEGVLDLA